MSDEILTARFESWAAIAKQQPHVARNGLFLPEPSPAPQPFTVLTVRIVAPDGRQVEIGAQVVQIAPGVGIALTFDGNCATAPSLTELVRAAVSAVSAVAQTDDRPTEPAEVCWGADSPTTPALESAADDDDPTDVADADAGGFTAEHATLRDQVRAMATPEKMRLATHGDRSARLLLMKDTNKTIQLFVIQNKRITIAEIRYLAGYRQANPEVLARIGENREWVGQAAVLSALVGNPKTPTTTAVKLLRQLGQAELRRLAKSPNVPRAVSQAAKRLVTGS